MPNEIFILFEQHSLGALRDMKDPWSPETRPLNSIGIDEKENTDTSTGGGTDEKKSNVVSAVVAPEDVTPNPDIICTRSSALLMSLVLNTRFVI
jgi:hypothetical protein